MEFFTKILNGFQSLTFFLKSSILDVWQSSEYASEIAKVSHEMLIIEEKKSKSVVEHFEYCTKLNYYKQQKYWKYQEWAGNIPSVKELNRQRLICLSYKTYFLPLISFPFTKQRLATTLQRFLFQCLFNFCHENTNGFKSPKQSIFKFGTFCAVQSCIALRRMDTPSHQLCYTLAKQLKTHLFYLYKIYIGKLVNGKLLVFLHLIPQIH